MVTPEALFESWLAQRSGPGAADLKVLVRAHPEHAAALRGLHDRWLRSQSVLHEGSRSGSLAARLRAAYGAGLDPRIELPDEAGEGSSGNPPASRAQRSSASERYRTEREVARGGMGAVLQVWDVDLRRRLAMKVLLGERAAAESRTSVDRRLLARLLEEAQVTAQLDHPGIVPVHELGLGDDGEVFFTMKLVRGKTLGTVFDELAAGEGGWTQTRVIGHLVRVCEAMSYAHAKGVIHRDLKPANVMVGKFGEVYVMDWGLAKILGREDSRDVRVRAEALMTSEVSSNRRDEVGVTPDSPLCTMDGDVVGTPAYMSPEQANGRVSEMGPPSDVYALGAMLYHLLAGHMPYVPRDARLNNYAVWSHVQSGPPRSLREIAPKAPPELVAICERAMERTSAERYPDMQALATDLRAYVENRVVRAYEAGAWAEARKWVRRNKLLAASMSAAVLLLVIGLTVALHLNRELEAESSKLVAEIGSVKRLSALQDFADLVQRADDLWPPFPENIERYEAWIGQARAIAADLPLHRERLAELRGRALDATDRELAEDRATHPDFARLRQLPGLIASQRSALLQRRDGIEAREYRLDRAALSEKAPALIVRAWSLVSPGRSVFGREAEGVGFARRALELATQAGSRESMASAGNALSRGLFAIGRDRDALAASRAALKAAIQPEQKRFAILLADLERWVATASSPAGLAHSAQQLAALEAEQKELESRVNARRTWNFPDTQQGRESRWWHTNLARLIEDLAGLTDERTGLLSEVADAASAKHGWSVPRRLAFARRLQAGLSAGSPWSERWREAATAIRRHDKYGGLELSPQVGLVPIGPDPLSGLWEFWNVTTGTEPVRAADGHLVLTEQTGAVLVLIPPGTFWMGSSVDPKDRNYVSASASDERPVHEVTMSAFFLSKYEMTQAQWAWFVGRNPSMHTPPSALAQSLLHPVEQLSWHECMRQSSRMGLSLPSEAQWEYACRAATSTAWWTGAERRSLLDRRAANFADRAAGRARAGWSDIRDWPELDDGYPLHAPVATFAANPWGLYDVHGNVWEWCLDGYDSVFYAQSPKLDPCAPWKGVKNGVLRGGSYTDAVIRGHSANRAVASRAAALNNMGFRPCRAITK